MANIRERNGRFDVRWRWPTKQVPGGPKPKQQSKTCGSRREARRILAEVEACIHGDPPRNWIEDHGIGAGLEDVMVAHLRELSLTLTPKAVRGYGDGYKQLLRFLEHVHRGQTPRLDMLSKKTLLDWYAWLGTEGAGRHGKPLATVTRNKRIGAVQRFWSWAFEEAEDLNLGHVPRPRTISLKAAEQKPVTAPSWEEMDACVDAFLTEWHRRVAIIMRYTGLRKRTVMHLDWRDVRLEDGEITLQSQHDKNRWGRVVPISSALVREMATWGVREGYVIDCGRSDRICLPKHANGAWRRAGVDRRVWGDQGPGTKGQPWKAFRGGWMTGMVRLGVHREAIKYLVGHKSTETMDVFYVEAHAEALRKAVESVPVIGASKVATLRRMEG